MCSAAVLDRFAALQTIIVVLLGTIVYICKTIYQTNSIHHFMKTLKSILAAVALTVAATASAQTLKMEPQVVGVTTYEASTAINLSCKA